MYKKIRGVSLFELATAAFFVAMSGLAWWSAASFLQDGSRYGFFAFGILGAAMTLILLSVIDGTHPTVRRLSILIGFLLCIPLAFRFDFLVGILVGVLSAIFAEMGALRIQWAKKNYRTTPIGALAHAGLPFYFSAASILLSMLLFVSPAGSKALINPLPESWLRIALHSANPVIQSLTGFPVDGTFDQIASQITGSKDPRVLAEVRRNFEKRIGFTVSGGDDFSTLLSRATERQLEYAYDKSGNAYRFGFFISAFLLFRVLFIPIGWFAVIGAYLLTRFLKSGGGILEVEEPAVRLSFRWP